LHPLPLHGDGATSRRSQLRTDNLQPDNKDSAPALREAFGINEVTFCDPSKNAL
jgi:hypothetical protein